MEVTTRKTRKIPPFAVTVKELEELHGMLMEEFPQNEQISTTISIDVTADDKEYKFDSFTDLKQNYHFQEGVTEFSMEMSCDDYSVEISKEWIALGVRQVEVSATAPSVGWCAGVNEVATQCLKKHRVWYHWVLGSPVVELGLLTTVLSTSVLFTYLIPAEWRLDFLAFPAGLTAGGILVKMRPRKMATATLKEDQAKQSISWFDLVAKIIIPLATIGATAAATYVLKN